MRRSAYFVLLALLCSSALVGHCKVEDDNRRIDAEDAKRRGRGESVGADLVFALQKGDHKDRPYGSAAGQEGIDMKQIERDQNPHTESSRIPYPRSPVITHLEWAPASTIVRRAKGKGGDGSDNWPLTWADDDNLYTAYGDGYGFEPMVPEKLGLGFARVTGGSTDFTGENIRSDGENRGSGRSGKKGSGMLMVDGVLYIWLFHADNKGGQCQLAWSYDYAETWTFCDWKFREFGLCTFINYGKNYSGARDNYVYTVTHDGPMADGPADHMILMRVPRDKISYRAEYQFLKALDENGLPIWSSDIRDRGPVFKHKGSCLRSGISFSIPLKRYLWWQHIPNEPGHKDRGDTRFSGGFGIYDAPEPWGPWTTVYFTEQWDVGPGERAEFPTKWMSEDGKTLYLVFSGNDNFSVRRATLYLEPAAK